MHGFVWYIHHIFYISEIKTFEELRDAVVDDYVKEMLEMFYPRMQYNIMMYADMLDQEYAAVYKPVYETLKEIGLLDLEFEPFSY